MNVTAIAQGGLQKAFQSFEQSAERTARMGAPGADVDLGSEIVTQLQAKTAVSANIAVLRTADEMLGKLLDIKA
jgi:flagellar hook protein FlgE